MTVLLVISQQSVTLHRSQLLSIPGVAFSTGIRWGGLKAETLVSQADLSLLSFPEHQMNCRRKTQKKKKKSTEIKYEVRVDTEQQRQAGRAWLGAEHPKAKSKGPVEGGWGWSDIHGKRSGSSRQPRHPSDCVDVKPPPSSLASTACRPGSCADPFCRHPVQALWPPQVPNRPTQQSRSECETSSVIEAWLDLLV